MTALEPRLLACGCCEPDADRPDPIENGPGRSSLAYRCGTHGSFRATMLGRIARTPELRLLTTREPEDPSIALIDAWATVLDVLTFYQERIANEGYLRTATERRSVYELAAEIGYQPSPGVAATGWLAFELESGPGAPASAAIPRGVKVQSVPGQDEVPQTFETIDEVLARPAWNRIPVHATERLVPGPRETEAWIEGTATNLGVGDAILLVGRERLESAGSERWDYRLLTDVDVDSDRGLTRVAWEDGLGWRGVGRWVLPAGRDVRLYAFRERASLFGAAAPDWVSMPPSVQDAYEERAGLKDKREGSRRREWPRLTISAIADDANADEPERTIFLDAIHPRLAPGGWLVLQQPGYSELYRPDPALGAGAIADEALTGFTLTAKATRVVIQGEGLIEHFNAHVRDTTVFLASEELPLAERPLLDPLSGRILEVDAALDGFDKGRTVVVIGPRARLIVRERHNPVLKTADGSVVLQPRDVLTVTAPPARTGTATTWTVWTAAGLQGTVQVTDGDRDLLPIAAPDGAEVVAEAAVVLEVRPAGPDRTILELVEPLRNAFDRPATAVAANVAPATHGESKTEILGGGDGSVAFQAFALKQSPLTYVPAATVGGAQSTLQVEVNDVAWSEEPSLLDTGPRTRGYVVDVADDGSTTVRFGDGRLGARPPTGVENVRASYRVGIGTAGNLKAGQLSLLLTRPLGTRGVSNPLPTIGGADRESRDDARANAPRTVLTFDRVVSLLDFADFARSFAGVSKSEARWVWEGRNRVILLTIAGIGGQPVPQVPTLRDLAATITSSGDPHLPVRLVEAERLTFDLDVGVFVALGYDPERVTAAVRMSILDAFGFERRALAQPVTASEVERDDPGGRRGHGRRPRPWRCPADGIVRQAHADPPGPAGRAGREGPQPAQLLTVNPAGVTIARRT